MSSEKNLIFLQKRIAYARDEQAYKELFFHFYTPLHRLAYALLKDAETAEELVSDLMIKVWLMGPRLGTIENIKFYLYRSIRNATLTYISRSKLVTIPITDDDEIPENVTSASDRVEYTELQKKIEEAISSLPPKCRLVFRLIKDDSFSYREVSEILGVSMNTVKTHLRIAMNHVRAALEESKIK